jgi:propanol-preferring alcohol dehydrogenase
MTAPRSARLPAAGMRAMVLDAPGTPLRLATRAVPEPTPSEVVVRVHACGVCRTDLHVVDGELTAHACRSSPGTRSSAPSSTRVRTSTALRAAIVSASRWLARACGRWRAEAPDAKSLPPGRCNRAFRAR